MTELSTVPMDSTKLDRSAAADLWRNTLAHIPSVFGRLVYLSSRRDPDTGRYHHDGLAARHGEEECSRVLRRTHSQIFEEWINYKLEHQKADIDLYLSTFFGEKQHIIDMWLRLAPYRNLVPNSVRGPERKLYLTDLETILSLLKNEYGVSGPDQDS